jgi:hypothetical protein
VPARTAHATPGGLEFFSQILLFHPACLPDEVRRSLASLLPPEQFPRTLTFGDGSPVPDEPMLRFKEICEREAHGIVWRKGDIAWVDNMRVAHGRRPFGGERRILVAMGGMCTRPVA